MDPIKDTQTPVGRSTLPGTSDLRGSRTLEARRDPRGVERRAGAQPSLARVAAALAVSTGAAAVGALAVGAIAIGAIAISRLAIKSVAIGGARIKRLAIDELTIRRIVAREPEST